MFFTVSKTKHSKLKPSQTASPRTREEPANGLPPLLLTDYMDDQNSVHLDGGFRNLLGLNKAFNDILWTECQSASSKCWKGNGRRFSLGCHLQTFLNQIM